MKKDLAAVDNCVECKNNPGFDNFPQKQEKRKTFVTKIKTYWIQIEKPKLWKKPQIN